MYQDGVFVDKQVFFECEHSRGAAACTVATACSALLVQR